MSFWCLWKCCIYRGLGLLAGRLEQQLDRSPATPKVGEAQPGERECAASARRSIQLERAWVFGTGATSQGLAKALAVKQNMDVSKDADCPALLKRFVRVLKARRMLEGQQRQPTCDAEAPFLTGDYTLEFQRAKRKFLEAEEAARIARLPVNQKAASVKVEEEEEPIRPRTASGDRRRNLKLALDVAARRDDLRYAAPPPPEQDGTDAYEANHRAALWLGEWKRRSADEKKRSGTFRGAPTLAAVTGLLEKEARRRVMALRSQFQRDDDRLTRALVLDTHAAYSTLMETRDELRASQEVKEWERKPLATREALNPALSPTKPSQEPRKLPEQVALWTTDGNPDMLAASLRDDFIVIHEKPPVAEFLGVPVCTVAPRSSCTAFPDTMFHHTEGNYELEAVVQEAGPTTVILMRRRR